MVLRETPRSFAIEVTMPVQRRDDEGVALAQVVEGLPQFLAFGVLAGLLVGEDADAPCFGECVDLPVEQRPLVDTRAYPTRLPVRTAGTGARR